MKTTTKIMIWSILIFITSIVLFLASFILMIMQSYDNSILLLISRYTLGAIVISFTIFSFSGLLVLDYKNLYRKITSLKNRTKYTFQKLTANKSARNITRVLFLFSILILTLLQKILFIIFDDSSDNDIKDVHNPTDHEKSNPLSDHYDQSYFSDRSWDFGFSDDIDDV